MATLRRVITLCLSQQVTEIHFRLYFGGHNGILGPGAMVTSLGLVDLLFVCYKEHNFNYCVFSLHIIIPPYWDISVNIAEFSTVLSKLRKQSVFIDRTWPLDITPSFPKASLGS